MDKEQKEAWRDVLHEMCDEEGIHICGEEGCVVANGKIHCVAPGGPVTLSGFAESVLDRLPNLKK